MEAEGKSRSGDYCGSPGGVDSCVGNWIGRGPVLGEGGRFLSAVREMRVPVHMCVCLYVWRAGGPVVRDCALLCI